MLSVLCNYLFIVEKKKMKKMLDLKRINREDEKVIYVV